MSHLLKNNRGFFYALGSAFLFGTQVLWSRFSENGGMSVVSFMFYRNLISFSLMMLIAKRQKDKSLAEDAVKASVHKVCKKDLLILSVAALVGMVITPLLLIGSYDYLNAGAATCLHFTYPLYISVVGIVLFKDKVNKKDIMCLAICMLGIFCLFSPGQVSGKGILMALASGIAYGTYTIILDKSGVLSRVSFIQLNKLMYSIATAIIFIVFLLEGSAFKTYTIDVYLVCIVAGVFLNVVGLLLYQKGIALVGGRKAAILSAAEPVTSLIIGMLIFNELVHSRELIGSALIVISSILTVIL